MSVIVFALIGVVSTPIGWIVCESIFLNSEDIKDQNPLLAELAQVNRSPYEGVFLATESTNSQLSVLGIGLSGPRLVFEQTVRPFYAIFGGATTVREFLYFAFGGFWSILVWSFVGLGITRVSLLRLTRNENAGLDDAFEFSMDFFTTSFSALMLPILAVALMCVPAFLIGLLMATDFGAMLVGLIWIVVLLIAFVIGIFLLGLFAGWPLVITSVAAEGQNAFDAVTRAYAYVFQRPVHYIFYALVAVVFGGIVWLVAYQFTDSVVRLSFWSTGWGANRFNENRIDDIKGFVTPFRNDLLGRESWISRFQDDTNQSVDAAVDLPAVEESQAKANESNMMPPKDPGPTMAVLEASSGEGAGDAALADSQQDTSPLDSAYLQKARQFIFFWVAFAKTVAAAFIHGLFWCMASCIYLLLRKDVDETEMDEIYVIEERRTYDLPPLQSDEHGIPQIQPLPLADDEALEN